MITPATQITYDALMAMEKQIAESEAHLRVLKASNFPGAMKLESDLAKAKAQRQDMLKAIKAEHERQ